MYLTVQDMLSVLKRMNDPHFERIGAILPFNSLGQDFAPSNLYSKFH